MSLTASNEKLQVKLAGQEFEVKLEIQKSSSDNQYVWLRVKNLEECNDNNWWYIVGLQSDGSIVRASSCKSSGLPMDERVSDEKVAIRMYK